MTTTPDYGNAADPPEDPGPASDTRAVYPPADAPLDVARTLYDAKFRTGPDRTLVSWRGSWMRWQSTHWAEVDTAELRAEIYETLGDAVYEVEVLVTIPGTKPPEKMVVIEKRPWKPNRQSVANVIEATAAVGHISSAIDTPGWLGLRNAAVDLPNPGLVVSCTNGLLDLTRRTLGTHTPRFFNAVSVPFDYDPAAAAPTAWLAFLNTLWADDPDAIALLQEYFGYLLSGRTDMQKMLLLIGPTRSGKGTIGRLILELIGKLHVAGPTLASLGTNFGLSPLLGKPVAIISDARLGDTPAHTVVERLLSITGEDTLTVDRKFRDPWSGKLPTRFVVLSNELPKFRDSSGAIANRMVVLEMQQSFLGREDRTLDRRLHAELPGILLWALAGLDRLEANGQFTIPESSRDATTLMADLVSPMSAFIRERCTRQSNDSVPVDRLFDAWRAWAEDNGHHGGSKAVFGRNLKATAPGITVVQQRTDGLRLRVYTGIGLEGEPRPYYEPAEPTEPPPAPEPPAAAETAPPPLWESPTPAANDDQAAPEDAAPVECRYCGTAIPATAPSQEKRGYCGKLPCITAARTELSK